MCVVVLVLWVKNFQKFRNLFFFFAPFFEFIVIIIIYFEALFMAEHVDQVYGIELVKDVSKNKILKI